MHRAHTTRQGRGPVKPPGKPSAGLHQPEGRKADWAMGLAEWGPERRRRGAWEGRAWEEEGKAWGRKAGA